MKTDLEIQDDIISELKWQPFLKAANIGVSVNNGIVTLSGHVESFAQKMAAERAAKKVSGVKAIAEDIQIGVSPFYRITDTEIAESVITALKNNCAVPHELIKVKVENGTVTLEGEVDWEYQRSTAVNSVAGLIGVKNVMNLISVKAKATVTDIKSKIIAALERNASVCAKDISVEVEGNKVILRGTVDSISEKEDAEDTAWAAPGITSVESHLHVESSKEYVY